MNREILFRGKRENSDKWVYGFYTNHCVDHLYVARIERTTFSEYGEPVEYITVDNKTVGQYIGLQDSKSNKIFEGDIVKSAYDDTIRGVIAYDLEFGKFYVDIQNGYAELGLDDDKWEIIGNIHDNPELLTDKT